MTAAPILTTVRDLEAALIRLQAAADADAQRVVLEEALTLLFTVRDMRHGQGQAAERYRAAAGGCHSGQSTEGLVLARHLPVRDLTYAVPTQNSNRSSAGADTFLDDRPSAGAELTWLRVNDMRPAVAAAVHNTSTACVHYDVAVAGRGVLRTLAVAKGFLIRATPLGPLAELGASTLAQGPRDG